MFKYISAILLFLPFAFCNKKINETIIAASQLSVGNVTVTRDSVNTKMVFTIVAEPVSNKPITVNYTTVEGTAKATIDFVPISGTLSINPNMASQEVVVQVNGKKLPKSTQEFYLKLSDAVNANIKVEKATAFIQNPGFGYQLVWSDEFDSTVLNTKNWNYETGGNGWGNRELQNYIAGTNNAYIENGKLVIEAKKESVGGNPYTSARLTTKGKVKFTYGKIEIRAKVPTTKGIWPALWMLGESIDQVSWPACGEIDIMESINKEQPSKIYGTAHWGTSGATHKSSGGNAILTQGFYSDDYHIYSLEWDEDNIQWFVDGNKYYGVSNSQVTGGNFPFNKDFFIILNVAVGGDWPGNPDFSSIFPQKMMVDYIRVYQK